MVEIDSTAGTSNNNHVSVGVLLNVEEWRELDKYLYRHTRINTLEQVNLWVDSNTVTNCNGLDSTALACLLLWYLERETSALSILRQSGLGLTITFS